MNRTVLKNIGIYAGILLLFIGLAYGFTPQVLDGKIVNQSDIASWKGMANEAMTYNEANPEDPMMEAAASINILKNKGVQAGVLVIVLCLAYAALFEVLGYVLASTIIAAIIMWLIGKRDVKQIVLVSVLVPLLMWFVFYKLLTVNNPMGVLEPLKNLIDMI